LKIIGVFLFFAFSLSCHAFVAAEFNYRKEFGQSYDEALKFLSHNKWMADSLRNRSLCPALCFSIVFPEIVRYNIMIDAIQISALEMLYIQYGADYSDFSIGRFQMKPSFAEMLEKDWIKIKNKPFHVEFSDFTKDTHSRKARIRRLESLGGQLDYLSIFVTLCFFRYKKEMKFMSPEETVRFIAAAYNAGYRNDPETLKNQMNSNSFHTDFIPGLWTKYYNYSDIAADFYSNYGVFIREFSK
jgi:hypothetical protein